MIGEVNCFPDRMGDVLPLMPMHRSCADLDGWLRRKLRCVRLKHCKQPAGLRRFLWQHGVSPRQARELAASGRGWWRLANSPCKRSWLWTSPGSTSWAYQSDSRHTALNARETAVVRDPYARWCERGGPRGTSLLDSAMGRCDEG